MSRWKVRFKDYPGCLELISPSGGIAGYVSADDARRLILQFTEILPVLENAEIKGVKERLIKAREELKSADEKVKCLQVMLDKLKSKGLS